MRGCDSCLQGYFTLPPPLHLRVRTIFTLVVSELIDILDSRLPRRRRRRDKSRLAQMC
jgi:hypothetical protein